MNNIIKKDISKNKILPSIGKLGTAISLAAVLLGFQGCGDGCGDGYSKVEVKTEEFIDAEKELKSAECDLEEKITDFEEAKDELEAAEKRVRIAIEQFTNKKIELKQTVNGL